MYHYFRQFQALLSCVQSLLLLSFFLYLLSSLLNSDLFLIFLVCLCPRTQKMKNDYYTPKEFIEITTIISTVYEKSLENRKVKLLKNFVLMLGVMKFLMTFF